MSEVHDKQPVSGTGTSPAQEQLREDQRAQTRREGEEQRSTQHPSNPPGRPEGVVSNPDSGAPK